MFLGDDFHINLPSQAVEVTFRARSAPRAPEVLLMREGSVVNSRAKLNLHLSYLILENVVEADEGVYTVKNPNMPDDVQRITLIVRGIGGPRMLGVCDIHECDYTVLCQQGWVVTGQKCGDCNQLQKNTDYRY